MSLESLKISEVPAAFFDFAQKHNALIEVLKRVNGVGGIKVVVGEDGIIVDGSAVSGTGGSIETRVTALETLTSGLSQQSVSYCSGGSTTSKTILMS